MSEQPTSEPDEVEGELHDGGAGPDPDADDTEGGE